MPYILNTQNQIKDMLHQLGLSCLDDLYAHIPSEIVLKNDLDIPSGLSEHDLQKNFKVLANKNKDIGQFNSFLGAGVYDHYIPAALNHLLYRTEFYTSYTPYQAECSQGSLKAIYEYQSFMCILTGMDVTNASLYDGATALAEAVLMSMRLRKGNKVIVALRSRTHKGYAVVCKINRHVGILLEYPDFSFIPG